MNNLFNIFVAVFVIFIIGCLLFGCSYRRGYMYEGLENKDDETKDNVPQPTDDENCADITDEGKCLLNRSCLWKSIDETGICYPRGGDTSRIMQINPSPAPPPAPAEEKKQEPEGFSNYF